MWRQASPPVTTSEKTGTEHMLKIVLSYLAYAIAATFTPGPNTLLSFHAVSSKGWKQSRPILLGIFLGIYLMLVLAAVFSYAIGMSIPGSIDVLKYIGAAYIVYLSFKIFHSRLGNGNSDGLGFGAGFLLELVNAKLFLYGVTVFCAYVLPAGTGPAGMFLHATILFLIAVAGNMLWAAAGGFLSGAIARHERLFDSAMAILLLWCAVKIVLS